MSIDKWANSRLKKLKWYHISFIKISTAAFALMVAKLWPGILGLEWYWYLVIALVVAIPVYTKVFGK